MALIIKMTKWSSNRSENISRRQEKSVLLANYMQPNYIDSLVTPFSVKNQITFAVMNLILTGNSDIDQDKPQLFLLFTGLTDSGNSRRLKPSIALSRMLSGKYLSVDCISPPTKHGSKIAITNVQNNQCSVSTLALIVCIVSNKRSVE